MIVLSARQSLDREAPMAFRNQLIAVCQDASLPNFNGKVDDDISGQLTCHTHNGSSLVDYFIASPPVRTERWPHEQTLKIVKLMIHQTQTIVLYVDIQTSSHCTSLSVTALSHSLTYRSQY